MSRPFNTDAGLCIPRMVPWRGWDEWYQVKAMLFSTEPYLRSQGVQHVAVWQSRERIPHAVETTSQLVEVRLNDIGAAGGGPALHGAAVPFRRSEEELRLIYSAVVVRAVNGLTGHEQKTAHAAPVSSLAREIGLPTWIVDIRHEAAHKQLPGIVTLRLAADFLVDYLWRRYWGPQAEHLSFVWGAFDQLISRYKATSDDDALLPRNNSPPPPNNKRRRADYSVSTSASTAAATAAPGSAVSRKAPSPPSPNAAALGSKGPSSLSSSEPTHASLEKEAPSAPVSSSTLPPPRGGHGITATVAMEVAAHEIALSATPTALSWALVSLLADGGGAATSVFGTSGGGGGGCGEAKRRRGQGHLLPRSRDRYPTPGTPGVDSRRVARRLTSRWATLLDMFHTRWRGFGAALLVRLVEALLDLSAAALTLPKHDGAAQPSCGVAGGGGSGGGGGGREGMRRQAAFIEIWVQHLLSRRWHLRASDVKIRKALMEDAGLAGLSPAFCEKQEAFWGQEESAWADEPAPVSVLRAAFFPVRELLERCRRSLDLFAPAAEPTCTDGHPSTGGEGDAARFVEQHAPSTPAAAAGAASNNSGANWARAGISAVCRALAAAAALPDGGAALHGETAPQGRCGSAAGNSAGGGGSGDGDPSVVSGGGRDDGDHGNTKGESDCTEEAGRSVAPSATAPATDTTEKMMDLDDLERLLGGEGSPQFRAIEPAAAGAAGLIPSVVAPDTAVAAASANDAALDSGFGRVTWSEQLKPDDGDAWEMVETWTPCAIGTLPGWSAARLY